MDAYTDPEVGTLVFMKSSQVGATEIINNIIGYIIDLNPGPLLLIQPTIEMAQAWSKDRFAPMLRDTPALHGKVKDPRSRDSGNTMLHKSFPAGHITMAGANSPASLASRPIRDVLCDEVDRYPPSAGTEGDPISLAKKRTTTFFNSKLILTSTPTIKGASRIETAYESSNKGRYYVPCLHCDEYQFLKWSNVQWEEDKQAYYVCDCCGSVIEEKDKALMLQEGEWRFETENKKITGFHISELYSPWVKWNDVKDDFLQMKGNRETLKTFTNTSLGETWEETGEEIDESFLYTRREDYDLPVEVNVLTAAVDVQEDRLEVEVIGWAAGKENWSVDYKIIQGDVMKRRVWDELTHYLKKDFPNDNGTPLKIAAAGIDSGYQTQIVYDYCKTRPIDRLYALKGKEGAGRPIANPRDIIGYPVRRKVIIVGADTAKTEIYASLRETEMGEGYSHFPDRYDMEYFNQLTAEKCVTKFQKGFPTRVWIKTRARNEALDLRVYNYAALTLLNPDLSARIEYTKPDPGLLAQTQKSSFIKRPAKSWVNNRDRR
jgi:phage terminase large subunit GpA-like protein